MSDEPSATTILFSPDVREWAVRLFASESETVSRDEALASVCAKVGCSPATLRAWLRQVERAGGFKRGMFGASAPMRALHPGHLLTILHEPIGPEG